MQENNIYAPPEANLQELVADPANYEFYVVSKGKFSLLFFLTFGMYAVYWHYRNWVLYKRKHEERCIPVLRAIFSIFFTHTLFGEVKYRLKINHPDVFWNSGTWATLVVAMVLLERISEKLPSEELSTAIPLVCFIAHGILLLKAQAMINLACNDPTGISNSRFTLFNYFWVAIFPVAILVVAFDGAAFLGL